MITSQVSRSSLLLTEVLRTDPDSEVLLSFLRQTHSLHYLLYSSIVSMFQLNRAIWPIHTINPCLLILHKNLNILNKELVKILSVGASEEEKNFTIIQQHPYCWEKEHCTIPAYSLFIKTACFILCKFWCCAFYHNNYKKDLTNTLRTSLPLNKKASRHLKVPWGIWAQLPMHNPKCPPHYYWQIMNYSPH